MRPRSRSITVSVGAYCALLVLSCSDPYTGPFTNPGTVNIPSFADSAFGSGLTQWFAARTFDSIMAAGLDAQSIYSVEAKGATNSLVAIRLTNGAHRWTKTVPAGSFHIVSTGAVVAAVGSGITGFQAISGDSALMYTPPFARRVSSNGATDGTSIIVGNAAGELVGLNPTTGAEVWAVSLDTAAVKGVHVSGGVAYAGGNGFLVAVTLATRAQKWKRVTTDNPRPSVIYAPAVDSSRVTIATLSGAAFGMANYDATAGVWGWSLANSYPTTPFEAPGQAACSGIVTTNSAASLNALAYTTGQLLWSKGLNPFSLLSASCANGTVVVNARMGATGAWYNDVLILAASDGAVKAQYPKTAGQQLRIHRVMRNASAVYFMTATGVAAILAP